MPQLIVTAAASALGISAGTLAYAALEIGASLFLSAAASALVASSSRQSQPELKRDLSIPQEKPPYRFVYGRDLAVGTPAPVRVRGEYLVGCWLLNSRPSALTNLSLFLDKRPVTLTGDPFDFTSGGGATGTTFPFKGADGTTDVLWVWFGRGDQTTVPHKIRTEYPWAATTAEDLFKTTDTWKGRTVMWAIMRAGGDADRQERWPSVPPLVEVLADWSKVWDPRDNTQDPDDPATWDYSANQALCILDALRQNPVRPYSTGGLFMPSFEDAADICDELVPLKAGGNEPRYSVTGTVVWQNTEIEDQLGPLYAAGAARPIRVGGRLGICPGAYMDSVLTVTDMLEGGIEITGTQAGDIPNVLRTSYTSASRLGEDAELTAYSIPGALTADAGVPLVRDLDLRFAGSPTQAQRVQKIEGAMLRRQRRITFVAPPAAANLVAGSNFTLSLPAPWNAMNGAYRVERIHPAIDLVGEGGVALRCPVTAVWWAPGIYAWDEDTDEVTIVDESFDGSISAVLKPTPGSAIGADGSISTTWTMPATGVYTAIEVWGSDTNDASDASLLRTISASAGQSRGYTESGLGASVTRYYFARSRDNSGRFSGFTSSLSATTDP